MKKILMLILAVHMFAVPALALAAQDDDSDLYVTESENNQDNIVTADPEEQVLDDVQVDDQNQAQAEASSNLSNCLPFYKKRARHMTLQAALIAPITVVGFTGLGLGLARIVDHANPDSYAGLAVAALDIVVGGLSYIPAQTIAVVKAIHAHRSLKLLEESMAGNTDGRVTGLFLRIFNRKYRDGQAPMTAEALQSKMRAMDADKSLCDGNLKPGADHRSARAKRRLRNRVLTPPEIRQVLAN